MTNARVYFVGTPIGNLEDITFRAINTLNNVDYIACEDTRHSSILLNTYNIHKPTFSYHKFNEKTASKKIIDLVKKGQSVAIITDAGMPAISDPGSVLIEALVQNNIDFEIIPGVSAVTCAVVGSGLDTAQFIFCGFLPDGKTDRLESLKKWATAEATLIIYSADHDLNKDLEDCYSALGNRQVVVANDLTKKFENYFRGTLDSLKIENPKGEFVILIEGKSVNNALNELTLEEHLQFYVSKGIERKEALKLVAKDLNVSKSTVYNKLTKK